MIFPGALETMAGVKWHQGGPLCSAWDVLNSQRVPTLSNRAQRLSASQSASSSAGHTSTALTPHTDLKYIHVIVNPSRRLLTVVAVVIFCNFRGLNRLWCTAHWVPLACWSQTQLQNMWEVITSTKGTLSEIQASLHVQWGGSWMQFTKKHYFISV